MKYPQMLATMVKCTICYSCGANRFLFQGAAIMALLDVNGDDIIHRRGKTTKRLGVSLPDSFYAICIHSFRVSGELIILFLRCNCSIPPSHLATSPIGRGVSHYSAQSVSYSLLYPLCPINLYTGVFSRYLQHTTAYPWKRRFRYFIHPVPSTHIYNFITCDK